MSQPERQDPFPEVVERLAFGLETAKRISGLSTRQIRYMADTGFYEPEAGEALFSFRDLVGLRTIGQLRQRRVSLQSLRALVPWLHRESATPWASLRFWVLGRTAYFAPPGADGGPPVDRKGQRPFPVMIEPIRNELARELSDARRRPDALVGKIQTRRGVQGGQPCIAGTRIPVRTIVELRRDGWSDEKLLRQYPTLRQADIEAASAWHEAHRRRTKVAATAAG